MAEAPTTEMDYNTPRKRKPIGRATMQLNLTSMIDVIFQLLIYFVITASFTVDEGVLTTKLPGLEGETNSSAPKPPERPLNIVISTEGHHGFRIRIEGLNRAPADFAQLGQMLVELQYDPTRGRTAGAYKPDNPVIIKPDATARWQHVVNAFNAAIEARYSNVSFARVSEDE